MAWYPKAIKKPITKHNTPMSRYRGIAHHVAAGESSSLYGYFMQVDDCSHFYVRRTGVVEQYVDTRFCAPAQMQGNSSIISIETQGGASDATANAEPWTAEAVHALIELDAWIAKTHNIPLRMMQDSKSSSSGFGYHRLGIEPWRIDGAELWSRHAGKICPGNKKIDQVKTAVLPGVIRLLGSTTTTPTEDELSAADVKAINDYSEQVCLQIQKHVDQVLASGLAAAKDEIKTYTAACATSVKDYVRQTDNEAQILAAVTALAKSVTDLTAKVDALPKA